MEENILKRRIVIKIIISIFLLIILYFIFFIKTNEFNDISISDNMSTTSYKNEYSKDITKFISFIKTNNLSKAYNMISDECKNQVFNNDEEKFKSYIQKYNFDSDYVVSYLRTYEDINSNLTYIFQCELDGKNILIHIVEYKPYDHKLYLVLDSEG